MTDTLADTADLARLVVLSGLHAGARCGLPGGGCSIGSGAADAVVLSDAGIEPGHIVLKGTNKTATSTDDITLNEAGPTSTEITYHANIEFNGIAKLADPLAGIAFERVGKETEEQMTAALQK